MLRHEWNRAVQDSWGQQPTYVGSHLASDAAGLGFNSNEPNEHKPFPDAWCDDCEAIRAAHDGCTEESEKAVTTTLLCSGCYERSRIRNTRTSFTLNDLAAMRWKCGSCEEWHTGACLDYGYCAPHYWRDTPARASAQSRSLTASRDRIS